MMQISAVPSSDASRFDTDVEDVDRLQRLWTPYRMAEAFFQAGVPRAHAVVVDHHRGAVVGLLGLPLEPAVAELEAIRFVLRRLAVARTR